MKPSTALVLETHNLNAGAPRERVEALERLLRHLRSQTRPASELVITHQGLSLPEQERMAQAAGRSIAFVLMPADADYYAAKNLGFAGTRADVVAFGDSDCWPQEDWLERLFAPFEDAKVQVVAGRTCYRADVLGTAATTIDFMYFPSPLGEGCTRNFYANNVAFQREAFAADPYRTDEGFYRGNCQTLGLRLHERGVAVRFEPRARTTHRFPDSRGELLRLRLLRGADLAEMAPMLAERHAPRALRPVLALRPVAAAVVLMGRVGFSLASFGHQDMPELKGARRVASVASILAISAVDGVGALLKLLGLSRLVGHDHEPAHVTLSYVQDRDRLNAA